MSKSPKDDVNYSLGHLHSHCGPTFHDDKYFCRHFIPHSGRRIGACDRVDGQIDPIYWCSLYQKIDRSK